VKTSRVVNCSVQGGLSGDILKYLVYISCEYVGRTNSLNLGRGNEELYPSKSHDSALRNTRTKGGSL